MLLKDLTKSKECVNIEYFPINMVSGEYDFRKLKIMTVTDNKGHLVNICKL